jgi:flagellar biosynthesis/type III secretory pathway protein FliH
VGRVLKRVEMESAAYSLTVPLVVPQFEIRPPSEADPLFAAEHAAPPSDRSGLDGAIAPATAPAIDLDAVRAEADALLANARADAAVLIAESRARAQTLTTDAQSRVTAIETEAHARGFEGGDAAGRASADASMEDMLETMRGLIDVARTERVKLLEAAEPEIVRLATDIAERILHDHIALDPETVVGMTRQALGRLIAREKVTVRVNPADVELLRSHRQALLDGHDVENIRVVEDQRVDRGGVLLETESGTIDAKISSQLREARRVLHVEDLATPQAS